MSYEVSSHHSVCVCVCVCVRERDPGVCVCVCVCVLVYGVHVFCVFVHCVHMCVCAYVCVCVYVMAGVLPAGAVGRGAAAHGDGQRRLQG